jgi:hypothetical protein
MVLIDPFRSRPQARAYDQRTDLYAVRERRGGPLVESGFVVLGGPLEGDRDERWTILLDGRRWAENTF